MLWEAMGACTVTQERDVTERWLAIDLLAEGDIGHRLQRAVVDVLGFQPQWSIPTPGETLRGVQAEKVAPGKLVKDAPYLSPWVGGKVGGRGLAARDWVTSRRASIGVRRGKAVVARIISGIGGNPASQSKYIRARGLGELAVQKEFRGKSQVSSRRDVFRTLSPKSDK
jgi:hypothetical protein